MLASALALLLVADLPPNFVTKSFENADGTTSKYVVYVPPKLGENPPVILFLHGSGETKGGAKMPAEVGIGPALVKRPNFPAVVVIPQSEKRTWGADTPDGKRALAALDAVVAEYKCDPKRVYLSGLSMGGYGAWSIAAAYPEKWAALVPVCGGGKPSDAEKLSNLPIWCFHGDEDKAVPVARSREMIESIRRAGGSPVYTEYKGVGHNSWDKAYGTDELYDWLLAQRRK